MASRKSPTARTMEYLRRRGVMCGVVEKYNQFSRKRSDLFGFIDLIAADPKRGIIGVQCCGVGGSHAKHKRKILVECRGPAIKWLRCGGTIEIWSWHRRVRKGKRPSFEPRVEVVDRSMFPTMKEVNRAKKSQKQG